MSAAGHIKGFTHLGNIVFRHDYFAGAPCDTLVIVPSQATQKRLDGHRIRLTPLRGGLKLITENGSDGQPLIPIEQSITASFYVYARSGFTKYTALPPKFPVPQLFHLTNTSRTQLNLQQTENKIPDHNNLVKVALVELTLDPFSAAQEPFDYAYTFPTLSLPWTYCIICEDAEDELSIVDKNNAILFEQITPISTRENAAAAERNTTYIADPTVPENWILSNESGTGKDFEVTTDALQSAGPSDQSATLQALIPCASLSETTWMFTIKTGFAPSSVNLLRVFVAASDERLMDSASSGYFIEIGQTGDDRIRFIRLNEGTETPLTNQLNSSTTGTLAMSGNIEINVKVTCDAAHNWSIYQKDAGTDTFTLVYQCTDVPAFTSAYFGLQCQYRTTSRATLYRFENISITSTAITASEPAPATNTATGNGYAERVLAKIQSLLPDAHTTVFTSKSAVAWTAAGIKNLKLIRNGHTVIDSLPNPTYHQNGIKIINTL